MMKLKMVRREDICCNQYVLTIDDYELQQLLKPQELEAFMRQAQSTELISAKLLALTALAREIERRQEELRHDKERRGEQDDGAAVGAGHRGGLLRGLLHRGEEGGR